MRKIFSVGGLSLGIPSMRRLPIGSVYSGYITLYLIDSVIPKRVNARSETLFVSIINILTGLLMLLNAKQITKKYTALRVVNIQASER